MIAAEMVYVAAASEYTTDIIVHESEYRDFLLRFDLQAAITNWVEQHDNDL